MSEFDWKRWILLKPKEKLRHEGSKRNGFMGEEDIESYSILSESGNVIGSVTVRDHKAVKGFRRTINVIQRDELKRVLLDKTHTFS